VKDKERARARTVGETAQGRGGIGQMQQDETADDGVEGFREFEIRHARNVEAHVAEAGLLRPFARLVDHAGRLIDAGHRPVRSHERCGQKRDIARAAAQIEHAHTGREPRAAQDLFGQIADEARLILQSLHFRIGMAEHVGAGGTDGRIHGCDLACACPFHVSGCATKATSRPKYFR
jgi:hypothetical protein